MKKKTNKKAYILYMGLLNLAVCLLIVSLFFNIFGLINITTMFTILEVTLLLLIIVIFIKSKI